MRGVAFAFVCRRQAELCTCMLEESGSGPIGQRCHKVNRHAERRREAFEGERGERVRGVRG